MPVPKSLLQQVIALPPFLFDRKIHDSLAETPDIPMDSSFPNPTWTYAKKSKDGNRLPQTIAHRGYKAKHPENTMGAFKGAVKAGTHAIETDIHLSKDGVVVLSHDATLRRCFGKDEKIIDCTWDYLSKLRTLKEPHEPMPQLGELLEFLASPGQEDIWLLLDIKLDNDADTIMRLISHTIQRTPPSPTRPWNQRILLGCWACERSSGEMGMLGFVMFRCGNISDEIGTL
ncbi:glycerophosphoryl diester phosphodiesterase protein [Lasallia pustulata]|uniref:Glycerophosphoryl diester phosphodiesterase protein n=1 Tax=Lasallia pustulata TaxID=136370 RepID=A0A1W5CW85_9LECA|nr:glycerophosphoryl diester phosphodiesterase protein [Lasallia pustulata]